MFWIYDKENKNFDLHSDIRNLISFESQFVWLNFKSFRIWVCWEINPNLSEIFFYETFVNKRFLERFYIDYYSNALECGQNKELWCQRFWFLRAIESFEIHFVLQWSISHFQLNSKKKFKPCESSSKLGYNVIRCFSLTRQSCRKSFMNDFYCQCPHMEILAENIKKNIFLCRFGGIIVKISMVSLEHWLWCRSIVSKI